MPKVKYAEGDWFAVPLRDGGFASGLIARASRTPVLLGYFFGPRRQGVPDLAEVMALRPGQAVLIKRFGDLGLLHGTWPLLGSAPGWDRRAWPTPMFVRNEELTGRTFRVVYDDADPSRLVREEQVPPGVAGQGPKDGLAGAGFVELALTSLLHK